MTASGDHDGRTVSAGGRTGRNNRLIGVGAIAFAVGMIGAHLRRGALLLRLLPGDRLRGHAATGEGQYGR